MKKKNILEKGIIFSVLALSSISATAQTERVEAFAFGNMDKWMVREVEESFVIGGNTRYLYEITSGDTLKDNTPYKNIISPWATSTVMAKVKGVTKASITVFPEVRDNGYSARLETRIENCKVLGLININVLASGTIFLGEMVEPITSTDNPQSKLVTGIPFTKKPKAVQFDYKVITGGKCIMSTGFSKKKDLEKTDMAEAHLLLQKRWEDADGTVHAKRIGTGWQRFGESQTEWQNKHQIPVHYGDITKSDFFEDYMDLKSGDKAYYTRNSKGNMVPIIEEGWANKSEDVTHIILQFSSSNGGAYIGNTNSKLWIDNVGLVYDNE